MAPYQKPGVPESHGLTAEQCREAMWTITPDGKRRRSREPRPRSRNEKPPPDGALFAPLRRPLQELAYAWVALNRRRFPGVTAYCTEHPEECGGETGP